MVLSFFPGCLLHFCYSSLKILQSENMFSLDLFNDMIEFIFKIFSYIIFIEFSLIVTANDESESCLPLVEVFSGIGKSAFRIKPKKKIGLLSYGRFTVDKGKLKLRGSVKVLYKTAAGLL